MNSLQTQEPTGSKEVLTCRGSRAKVGLWLLLAVSVLIPALVWACTMAEIMGLSMAIVVVRGPVAVLTLIALLRSKGGAFRVEVSLTPEALVVRPGLGSNRVMRFPIESVDFSAWVTRRRAKKGVVASFESQGRKCGIGFLSEKERGLKRVKGKVHLREPFLEPRVSVVIGEEDFFALGSPMLEGPPE